MPRGLYEGVCSNPGKLDPLIRAQDAYGALLHLQELPYVDPKRIALIGWSHGGTSSLIAVDSAAYSNYPEEPYRRFKGVVAYYPGCAPWATSPTTFAENILLLIGDSDDWCSPNLCENMIKKLAPESKPVEFVLYPGATHSFDNPQARGFYLGHNLQYSQSATDDSIKRTLQFLKEHFQLTR